MKKRTLLISGIALLIIIIAAYGYWGKPTTPKYDYITAAKKNIIQEVSVTGKVKAAENIDLAFERSGKISSVNANVGDKVIAGQILTGIDDTDTRSQLSGARAQLENTKAQLGQYEAALEREKTKLDELLRGTRPEEIKIAETAVTNARNALNDAQTNLANVKNKAESDMDQIFDSAINTAAKSINIATNSLFTITDIQFAHFNNYKQADIKIADAKANAVKSLLGGENTGYWSNEAIGQLNGGAEALIFSAQLNPTEENINIALSGLKVALDKIKIALDIIPISSDLTTTENTDLSTEKSNINAEIITIASKQKSIEVQKITNSNSISAAEMSINTAQNTLSSALDNLALKKAGATQDQIATQETLIKQASANIVSQKAQIKQAESNVNNFEIQLTKSAIRSPINGIITKQDAKIGEIISANLTIVSLMSENKFQIEANVAEVDIAKIKIDNNAKITLDAYGSDVLFRAKIVSIDPAEIIIEGVPTYKVTLLLTEEDGRLKSGMTANIDILAQSKENIIAIPQRAVITKDTGDKAVQILLNDNTIKEVPVKTGLRGSDGNIEITEGLNEGDKIVVSTL